MMRFFSKGAVCVGSLLFVLMFPTSSISQEGEWEVPEWLQRTEFGMDVGSDRKPTAYFETVQPLYQSGLKEHTVFIQPRYSLKSEESAFNLGFGYRRLLSDNTILLGANTFFDFEDEHKHYRAGLGLEAYYHLIESRINTYFGLSPRRTISKVGSQTTYEKAVDGIDWEIGGPVPYMNWIKFFAGGFWYNYEVFDNKVGWRTRTEIKPLKHTTINVIAFDDNKGDVEVRVDARVSLAFGPSVKNSEDVWNMGISDVPFEQTVDHSDRTLDRVEREHEIEVETVIETASATIEVKRGD